MDLSLLPILRLKINAVLWDMELLCLRHGTNSGTQAGAEPMALHKVDTQLYESLMLALADTEGLKVQQRSMQVEKARRLIVSHLNDSTIGISER